MRFAAAIAPHQESGRNLASVMWVIGVLSMKRWGISSGVGSSGATIRSGKPSIRAISKTAQGRGLNVIKRPEPVVCLRLGANCFGNRPCCAAARSLQGYGTSKVVISSASSRSLPWKLRIIAARNVSGSNLSSAKGWPACAASIAVNASCVRPLPSRKGWIAFNAARKWAA